MMGMVNFVMGHTNLINLYGRPHYSGIRTTRHFLGIFSVDPHKTPEVYCQTLNYYPSKCSLEEGNKAQHLTTILNTTLVRAIGKNVGTLYIYAYIMKKNSNGISLYRESNSDFLSGRPVCFRPPIEDRKGSKTKQK